jgi:hypothetical protein
MEYRDCAGIVRDRRIKLSEASSVTPPIIDFNQALFTGERYKHTAYGSPTKLLPTLNLALTSLILPPTPQNVYGLMVPDSRTRKS